MPIKVPRLLLVPVSGPRGMGEFARSLAVANAVRARWPQVEVRFMLDRAAPYAAAQGHPVRLLPASATRCTREVLEELASFQPGLVYFDNSGRTRQLQAARAAGAALIYVSSRGRQRRKAFRLRWMRALDEHWISYPAALTGELTAFERLKLAWLGRPVVRFLDAVVPAADSAALDALDAPLPRAPDVVIVPGGGSQYPDAPITPAHFLGWGRELAAGGAQVVLVAGPSLELPAVAPDGLHCVRGLPGPALMALLARARLVLVNGGDTLVQALALRRPCVAVPIAGDQAARIGRAAAHGFILAPSPAGVVACCRELLGAPARSAALVAALEAAGLADATPVIVASIGRLLNLE
jgi:hypothetical protein